MAAPALPAPGLSRRQFIHLLGTLGVGATFAGTLAACGGPRSTGAPGGQGGADTIVATLAFTLSSGLDPMNCSSAVGTAANQHVFEGLVDLDPATRAPYPALARALPVASADGLTWTASLRDGARFSDGSAVTAKDVAWSFTRALDPANKALMAQFLPFLDTVTARDARTVEFHLKSPFARFARRIAVIKIVPRARTGDAAATQAFEQAPLGSGPWRLDRIDATRGLAFSANAHYNGPRPARARTMLWNTTTEGATRIADLRSGRVQAIEAVPYINVAGLRGEVAVASRQAFNQLFLLFNCAAKPFDDKRVRQALHYALDREAIVRTALQGHGSPARSYLDAGNPDFQPAETIYRHDPDRARALLAAAGVPDLAFELVTTDVAFIVDSAPLLIDQWRRVGVTASLNSAPSSAVYAPAPGGLVARASFQVLAASGDPSVFGTDADLLLRWFYGGTTWPEQRARWTGPARAEVTRLLDAAALESDPARQRALWQQVLDLIADEVPLYPVLHTQTVTAWNPAQLAGFRPAATTGLYFLDAERRA